MNRPCTDHQLGINQIDIFITFKFASPETSLCSTLYLYSGKNWKDVGKVKGEQSVSVQTYYRL